LLCSQDCYRLHRLAGRSYAQVHHVLGRLVHHGLVGVEHYGNARVYWLNREHVVAAHLAAIANSGAAVVERVQEQVAHWRPQPVAVVAFGSFARGEADADSDLDFLLVRPDAVDAEDAS
jgi:hypothetical protein